MMQKVGERFDTRMMEIKPPPPFTEGLPLKGISDYYINY